MGEGLLPRGLLPRGARLPVLDRRRRVREEAVAAGRAFEPFVVPTARGESEDGGVGVGEADEATSSSDAASARAAASAAAKALPASQ